MAKPDEHKRNARTAAIVIVVAMLGWMAVSFAGGRLGIPREYAFLADLAAMAAFVWALIVLLKIWRERQTDKDH